MRRERRLGIFPLKGLADDEVKRCRNVAEFLAQSVICDEVGVLLADGGDWCLGIFLDRSTKPFRDNEIALLNERLPVFASLHALDIRTRARDFSRTSAPVGEGDLAAPEAEHFRRAVAARCLASSSWLWAIEDNPHFEPMAMPTMPRPKMIIGTPSRPAS